MKEFRSLNPYEIQQKIWGKTCRPEGIAKRIDQAKKGWLPQGLTMEAALRDLSRFSQVLGEFAPRVLILANPVNPSTLIPEQLAVAGGWCALRTKDVATLNEDGAIMNPQSGQIEQVQSVDQVVRWIQEAVAFDQVIESIGVVNASEYAVISERKLWSMRVVEKLRTILNRKLSEEERNAIESAVENAEITRAQITKKYITYITGNESIVFQRVVDEDVWTGLERARNEMLRRAGLPLDLLQKRYPNERLTLPYSSLVWAMYSEPYFDMLRQEGYIKAKRVYIVEPSLHAAVETQSEAEMAISVYRRKGVYQDPQGFNANTGFIAYLECVNAEGKNARKELSIGDVPNIANWQNLFREGGLLDPEKNATLTPSENQIFLWGANLLPFRQVRQALLALSQLQETFKEEKKRLNGNGQNKNSDGRVAIQQKVDALKAELLPKVIEQNIVIASELKKLFAYLTSDIIINI